MAGLKGYRDVVQVGNERLGIGGDFITTIDGKAVTESDALAREIADIAGLKAARPEDWAPACAGATGCGAAATGGGAGATGGDATTTGAGAALAARPCASFSRCSSAWMRAS